ncbi:hypothetical protein DMB44_01920 [Thermoplasma sp. Kam2015]|uniref:hypothetical protein n=1 Tax=Thermoplasma sp. Kam2015 TaxID=2094122 RepID=UPI000D95DC15|nr:hypothetical protein [Thermoplasma sp. Kam2015]PYB68667.1 hypothetical protein DMB44_01920 [Thermoplasma sp. Kam2015]
MDPSVPLKAKGSGAEADQKFANIAIKGVDHSIPIPSHSFDVAVVLKDPYPSKKMKLNYIVSRDKFSEVYRVIRTLMASDRPLTKTELLHRSCMNFRTGSSLLVGMKKAGLIEEIKIRHRIYMRLTDLGILFSQMMVIISPFILSIFQP